MNDDLFGPSEPKKRKPTAKQAKRQAPSPKKTSHVEVHPEIKAVRMLDLWGILSPEDRDKHSEILSGSMTPGSEKEFDKWRQEHKDQ